MPIDVTCAACKTRFQVSEKFAGKKGPCPKCKAIITVPAVTEQVVIHAPEAAGPKDSKGQAVLKPIKRVETKLTKTLLATIIAPILLVLISAMVVRSKYAPPPPARPGVKKAEPAIPMFVLALGAILIAPPLAFAGYTFLRDDELEPYRGRPLLLRVLGCGAVYALLWAIFYCIKTSSWFEGRTPENYEALFIVSPLVLAGGGAGFAFFDFNYSNGLVHCGLYLLVTVALRLLIGLPIL